MIDTLELNKSQAKYLKLFNYILCKTKEVNYPDVVEFSLTDVLENMDCHKRNKLDFLKEGLSLLLSFCVKFEIEFNHKNQSISWGRFFYRYSFNTEDDLLEIYVNQNTKMLLPNFKFTVKED